MFYRDAKLTSTLAPLINARIDRREFLRRSLAMGIGSTAAMNFWSRSAEASTPKRGGTFRIALHDANTTDSFDPATPFGIYMTQLNFAFRSYLVEIKSDNTIGPELASSWTTSPDARVWTFKIRGGVEFHDGKTLTSHDISNSLNYHLKVGSKSAAATQLADVESVTADGDTVVIKCKRAFADLPYFLADKQLVIGPSDKSGAVDWAGMNGTGAYRITRHDPGIGTELVRHANFFKSDRGWFDAVQLIAVNDGNARIGALRTGSVDAISEFDLRFTQQLAASPDIEIDETPSGAHVCLAMGCNVAPFDNPDVRLALKYAINRPELIQKVFLGHGTIANDNPISPVTPFYAELPQREYDPERARSLLKKARQDGLKLSLSAADIVFAGAVDTAILFAEMCRPAGIEVNVVREADDAYWSNVWMNRPFFVSQWGGRPTPDAMFSLVYSGNAKWNETHWRNEGFDSLLGQAKSELDDTRRSALYREMQQICSDDGGAIIPCFRNRLNARRKNVRHGSTISGVWELDGGRSFERWWFEQ